LSDILSDMICRSGAGEEKIARLEKLCRIKIPKEYRDYLIKSNGAHCGAKRLRFTVKGCTLRYDCVQSFFGVTDDIRYSIAHWYMLNKRKLRRARCIPIGVTVKGHILLIKKSGEILLWDDCASLESSAGTQKAYPLAKSFGDFCRSLG